MDYFTIMITFWKLLSKKGSIVYAFFFLFSTIWAWDSPRLEQLEKEIQSDKEGALRSFVLEMRGVGTPLIEHIENDPDHYLVTFVWKGNAENVHLVGGLFPFFECEDFELMPLESTDLWAKTLILDKAIKASYLFSIDGKTKKLASDDPNDIIKTWKSDPYNLNPFFFLSKKLKTLA